MKHNKVTLWISRVLVWLIIAILIALVFTIPRSAQFLFSGVYATKKGSAFALPFSLQT